MDSSLNQSQELPSVGEVHFRSRAVIWTDKNEAKKDCSLVLDKNILKIFSEESTNDFKSIILQYFCVRRLIPCAIPNADKTLHIITQREVYAFLFDTKEEADVWMKQLPALTPSSKKIGFFLTPYPTSLFPFALLDSPPLVLRGVVNF